jgi:hypothetical protein
MTHREKTGTERKLDEKLERVYLLEVLSFFSPLSLVY